MNECLKLGSGKGGLNGRMWVSSDFGSFRQLGGKPDADPT